MIYDLKLDLNKINLVLSGLGKLQAEISFDLINEIHGQVLKKNEEIEKGKKESSDKEFNKKVEEAVKIRMMKTK